MIIKKHWLLIKEMVQKTEDFDILRIKDEGGEKIRDTVSIEAPLTIFLNGEELVTLLHTPSYSKQLAVGFLLSECFIKKRSDIDSIRFYNSKGIININTKNNGDASKKLSSGRVITSGCCGGTSFYRAKDVKNFKEITSKEKFSSDTIINLMKEMARRSLIFKKTGGVHSSALAKGGKIILFREDIGRHNAIDKIIGECFLSDIHLGDTILLTSGRTTSEITRKVGAAGIPVIASKSAPSSLSIKMAKELGLTLIGFVRGKRMNVYTEEWRIV